MPPRAIAFDHLRTFLTLLVVAHHAVLVYCTHAAFNTARPLDGTWIHDSSRWAGFDVFVAFNDTFFMPLMFGLAGLFAGPAVLRRGPAKYLRARAVRLGLPFLVAVLALMPLAWYPTALQAGFEGGLPAWWLRCLSVQQWPSGPAWFLWVLLVFDAVLALVAAVVGLPGLASGMARTSEAISQRPLLALLVFSAATALVLGLSCHFVEPDAWWAFGPFAVWASRFPLFALYYAAGLLLGGEATMRGTLAAEAPMARSWIVWAAAALAAFTTLGSVTAALPNSPVVAVVRAVTCALLGVAFLALFARKAGSRSHGSGVWRRNAFGIYVTHFVFVVWLQYALTAVEWPAVAKGTLVGVVTLGCSWALVNALRKVSQVARLL